MRHTRRLLLYAIALCPVTGPSAVLRAAEPRPYADHQIVRVNVASQADLDALRERSATILNCVPGVGPVQALVSLEQFAELKALGLPVTVLEANVEDLVDGQRFAHERVTAAGDPFEDFFLAYHPYGAFDEPGTILWYLNELLIRYPDLTSLLEIGTTIEGRTIWGLRVSGDDSSEKPAVLYFGCEHAREWIACTPPLFFATHVLENYGVAPAVTSLVDDVEFLLVPVFNVDGYVYSWTEGGRFWRKNRRPILGTEYYGVDLNRNWAEGWGGQGASSLPWSETYRGSQGFSEPETQALRDFILDRPNIRAQLDIHSFGEMILWPYGYTGALPPDQAEYAQLGSTIRSLMHGVHGVDYDVIGTVFNALYAASGVSIDWTYAQLDILSLTFELRPDEGAGMSGFDLSAGQIVATNEELLPAMLHVARTAWVHTPLRFEFEPAVPGTIVAGQDTALTAAIMPYYGSVVPGTAMLHYRYDARDPFTALPLTPIGGGLYEATLPATHCRSTAELFVTADSSTGVTAAAPRGAPAEALFEAGVVPSGAPLWRADMDFDPGWARDGAWAWGRPTGTPGEIGGPDPTSGYAGTNVFGYNLEGDYTNDMPEQHLTAPPVDCSAASDLELSFRRWLGVDSTDTASVSVSADGTTWTTVWANNGTVADTAWVEEIIDISDFAGEPTVHLRWTMGPTDGSFTACGWNIDDVRLTTTSCASPAGDFDGDNVVDLADVRRFLGCVRGPFVEQPPGCRTFDVDGDDDVDAADWPAIQAAITGPFAPSSTEP